jgi:hypothetical protein
MTGFDVMSGAVSDDEPESPDFLRARDVLKPHGLQHTVPRQIGSKFKSFLRSYAMLSDEDANFLWSIRGSVVHTYSLTLDQKTFPNVGVSNEMPWIESALSPIQTLKEGAVTRKVLNLWSLKTVFIRAANRLRDVLSNAEHERLGGVFKKQALRCGYIFVPPEQEIDLPSDR